MNMKLAMAVVILACFSLSGCAGLMVAGAGAGAAASQDRRTVPTQLEDSNIEIKTITALFKNDERNRCAWWFLDHRPRPLYNSLG